MESYISWIDHDSKARDTVMKLLSQKESRDELGLGGIRDSFSDLLFPGTSTIQTRLRYMLFIPWMYKSLEMRNFPSEDFGEEAEKFEKKLIGQLLKLPEKEHKGTIGKRFS